MSSYLQVHVYLSTHYRILFKHICSLLAEVFSTAVLVNSIMKCVGKVWVLHEKWKSHRKLRHRFLLESHMKASAWLQRFAKTARNLHISFKLNISVVHVVTLFKSWFWYWYFDWLEVESSFVAVLHPSHQSRFALLPSFNRNCNTLWPAARRARLLVVHCADYQKSTLAPEWFVYLSLSRLCFNPIGPPISQLIFTSEHFEHLWEMQDGKGMYSSKKCDVLEITCKSMQIL